LNQALYYVKTELGRAELRARRGPLSHKLRALLVMIDGKQTVAEYLEKLKDFGIDVNAFADLANKGLIEVKAVASMNDGQTFSPGMEDTPAPHTQTSVPETKSTERQLYEFYNSTIRDIIGLRGFTLQLEVEKAGTLEEYRALRERFLTAVHKTATETVARSLTRELDRLLN